MQIITLSDYENAIARYRGMAISMGAEDVIQCGSIQDPGISDIDCILLVNNWNIIKNSWKLLNPEIISPLFSHGPFVCPQHFLPDLLRYTTLRPITDRGLVVEPIPSVSNAKFIVATRQSGSLLHFSNILFRRQNRRRAGLILKSALHSMQDCSTLFDEANIFHGEIIEYRHSLDIFRKGLGLELDNHLSIECLRNDADRLLTKCSKAVADWIRTEFHRTSIDDAIVMRWFFNFVWAKDEYEAEYSNDLADEVFRLRNFIDEIIVGYISQGVLWRGAEFPFHQPNLPALGSMIWPRRFIKKIIVPIMSIDS